MDQVLFISKDDPAKNVFLPCGDDPDTAFKTFLQKLREKFSIPAEMDILIQDIVGYEIDGLKYEAQTIEQILAWQPFHFSAKPTFKNEEADEDGGITRQSYLNSLESAPALIGTIFVDISDEKKAQILEWSKEKLPQWRIARKGLCIEGICKNQGCKAFQKYVVINRGFINYNPLIDESDNKCPECNKYVKWGKVAFNNCVFKYCGWRKTEGSKPEKLVSPISGIVVGNHYKFWNSDSSPNYTWEGLRINVMPLDSESVSRLLSESPNLTKCAICLKNVDLKDEGNISHFPCKHVQHNECSAKISSISRRCVVCNSLAQ